MWLCPSQLTKHQNGSHSGPFECRIILVATVYVALGIGPACPILWDLGPHWYLYEDSSTLHKSNERSDWSNPNAFPTVLLSKSTVQPQHVLSEVKLMDWPPCVWGWLRFRVAWGCRRCSAPGMSAPAALTSRSAASSVPGLETGHTQHGTHLWNGVVIYSDIHMYRDLQMSRLCTENLRSLHECFVKVMGTKKNWNKNDC